MSNTTFLKDGWGEKNHDQKRSHRIRCKEQRTVPEQNIFEMKATYWIAEKSPKKKNITFLPVCEERFNELLYLVGLSGNKECYNYPLCFSC